MMEAPGVQFDVETLLARVANDPGAPEFPAAAEALRRSGQVERARDIATAGLECAPSRLAGRVALALVEMDLGRPAVGRDELEKVLDEMLEPYRLETQPEALLTPVLESSQVGTDSHRDSTRTATHAHTAFGVVAQQEIDAAFEEAEAQADEMHSPNRMAESILEVEAPFEAEPPRAASLPPYALQAAEGLDRGADEDDDDFDFSASGTFATRTMAGLLDQQGDHHRAASIRNVLGAGPREALARETDADPQPQDGFAPLDSASAAPASARPAEARRAGVGDEADSGSERAHRARVLATLETWLHNLTRRAA